MFHCCVRPGIAWPVFWVAVAMIAVAFALSMMPGCVSTAVSRDYIKRYTDGTVIETHTRLSGLAVYEDGVKKAVAGASEAMGTIWEQIPEPVKYAAGGVLGLGAPAAAIAHKRGKKKGQKQQQGAHA